MEPYLPQKRSPMQESAYYLVASLFALHTKTSDSGNLGNHMRSCNPNPEKEPQKEDALDRRFTALLAAHPDDLAEYLRHAISFLKSKEIPVNWNQLFWDLQNWDDDDRRVQKKWANAFWGRI